MELYVGHRPWLYEDPQLTSSLPVSSVHPAMPLGLGSAFAHLPPPPPLPELRFQESPRYLWDPPRLLPHHPHPHAHPAAAGLVGASTAPGLELPLIGGVGGRIGGSPLGVSPLGTSSLAANLGATTLGVSSLALAGEPHHPYRITPYMEHLYHSLHTSPQASLRGLSPLETRVGSDYLGMSGLAATRLSDPHLVPSTLTSADLSFSIDGSRLASPRPSLRQSRKRALSSSPYSDSFDLNSMIRFSPNSLVSIMNASRTSSASGSYGHLSAGAISPNLGVHPSVGAATTHLQQLQAHLMRGASLPSSPFLAPSPLLQHSPSSLTPHQSLFLPHQQLQPSSLASTVSPNKPESEKKNQSSASHNLDDDKNGKTKNGSKETTGGLSNGHSGTVGPPVSRTGGPTVNGGQSAAALAAADDDGLKEEPPDFIETHCNWKDCDKEFNTPEELVKHINSDHIHANKKSFVCRWKECSRIEKPFKAQYMLVVHMRRHTGEKPHRCTFEGCYKAYSRLENLKTHLRSHTGEKPYMCEFPGCTKAFSNASDRAKHQNRTHSNEKPYVCKAPGCTKRYTDPSSLRKHVKTVHGADFYASKKHKGNDHPNGNSGGPGNGNSGSGKDMGQPEGSPHSDGGKAGSMSSPSEATSPGDQHSPENIVGGVTPMDQSRLDIPIGDGNMINAGRFESRLDVDIWEGPEDDLDASIDLPLGLGGSINGMNGASVGVAVHDRAMRYRPMKGRMQAKGLVNLLPNLPGIPRRSNGIGTDAEFAQRIPDIKMGNVGLSNLQPNRKNVTDFRSGQTVLNNRRDSSSTVSTGYFSMQSPNSRRASELSQTSCLSGGRQGIMSSPYDHISIGSSRRSSDNSNYNFNGMGPQMFRPNQRAMCGNEHYNTSNLVVQTQNMSLSQDNLTDSLNWNSNMVPTMGNSMSAGMAATGSMAEGGQFGYSGPMGPVCYPQNSRDMTIRRASDPVRSLDRTARGNGRLQRTNSYSNFSQCTAMPSISNQTHPNQGLQLDQVGDDEPIENKLILPDDMVNYLNQKEKDENKLTPKTEESETATIPTAGCATMASPAYSNQPVNSPAYSNQNVNSPAYTGQAINSPAYTNQPVNSPAYSSQTPNTPQTYPNIASPPTPYQYNTGTTGGFSAASSPAQPQQHGRFPGQSMSSPAATSQQNHYSATMPSPAPSATNYTSVTSVYPQQGNSTQTSQNFVPAASMQNNQQAFSHYSHQQSMAQQQMYNQMVSHQQQLIHHHQQRYPSAVSGNYSMNANGYSQHVCGHFASMHLPPAALHLPCNSCQNLSSMSDMPYSQNHASNWQANGMNMNPHFQVQPHHSFNNHHNFNYMNHHYSSTNSMGGTMMNYPQSIRDIQCGDVSQSTQSKNKTKPIVNQVNNAISSGQTNVKAKPQKENSNDKLSAGTNGQTNTVTTATKQQLPCEQDKKNPKSREPTTDNQEEQSDKNNYMKQDTYQRTLEYVQQCQSWNTTVIKEEVSSTTDQKPNLNPNGTVTGYVLPPSVTTVANHPTISTVAPTTIPVSETAEYINPLIASVIEAPNMVLNNLSSSLNSLQQENKFLQMLQ